MHTNDCALHFIQISYHLIRNNEQQLLVHSQGYKQPIQVHLISTLSPLFPVLSDEKQRAIYDRLGMPGVHASWQLAQTNQSHRLKDILEALESSDSWSHRTLYDCGLDASIWFDQEVDIGEIEDIVDVLPTVRNMSIQQTFERRVDPNTSIAISLAMVKQYQQGGASITMSGTRVVGKNLQLVFALGLYGRRFGNLVLKQNTRIGEFSFGAEIDGNGSKHSLAWSKAIREDAAIGIALAQREGVEGLNLLIQMSKGTLEGAIGIIDRTLTMKKTVPITEDTNALIKFAIKAVQSKISIGMQRIWNQDAISTVSLQADAQEGVALKVSFRRRDFEISVPILLSPDLNPSAILYGSVLPALATSFLNSLVIKPFKRWKVMQDTVERDKKSKEVLEGQRLEAEIAAEILQKSNHLRVSSSLLKIIKAELKSRDNLLEVTVQLQYQVHDNQLRIPRGVDWCGMIGIYDIAPGETKQLSIEYVFKDQKHKALFIEETEVALPQRTHLINQ